MSKPQTVQDVLNERKGNEKQEAEQKKQGEALCKSSSAALTALLVPPMCSASLMWFTGPVEAFERKEFDLEDGIDALTLFSKGQGFTYDDIIMLPGRNACCSTWFSLSQAPCHPP
jgi:hypothetical protein